MHQIPSQLLVCWSHTLSAVLCTVLPIVIVYERILNMADITEIKDPKDIKGDKDDYDPRKKREIIKTVLIIFLALLLILTFFSNTIMNKSLPEIMTERTSSGKLTERLRGSGLVESNQSYGVKVDGNKVVDTIMVKTGQEVKKDDVLFTVGTGESEELTAAEEALTALELEYNKALLTPPEDYAAENQAIKNARDDLSAAIAKRDNAAANQGSVEEEKNNYKNNKAQLNYYTKLQTKLTAVISAIDSDEYMGAPAEYTGQLIELKNNMTSASAEYESAQQIYTAMLSGDDKDDNGDNETAITPEELSAAKADLEQKEQDYQTAKESYENLKYSLRNDYSSQLADAENNMDWYTALVDEYESGNSGTTMTPEDLEEDVRAKQRALEDLITQLNKTQKDNSTQEKIDKLDIDAKKKEIEKAKKKVKDLKKKNETTEIKAKYSGIVSAINIRAGEETVPETDLMTIDIAEEGYTVEISVEAEKTKKIKKGVAAEIVNNWNGNIEAVLTDIKNDTTPNSKNRILVFSVTGDVDSGSYLDLSIPCGTGNYDTIVPKSAVYTDKDGTFVLSVSSKSSPLGNRYFAERIPVEVVASDEISSAVQGNLSPSDYVIVASSKPINPKDQVRMKDQ